MNLCYRMDGTPYPEGLEGLMQWGEDIQKTKKRTIGRTPLPWGGLISTVWLGIDHSFRGGPPLIFESMLFDEKGHSGPMRRYTTLGEAKRGHEQMVKVYQTKPGKDS